MQPPRDESSRTAPLLPTSGVDAESVLDLPYAVDDEPPAPPAAPPPPAVLPPPPVLPPTFSAPPRLPSPSPADAALTPASGRERSAPARLPDPIHAGSLAGPVLFDDDFAARSPKLPPMVAKGGWNQDGAAGSRQAAPMVGGPPSFDGTSSATTSSGSTIPDLKSSIPPEAAAAPPAGRGAAAAAAPGEGRPGHAPQPLMRRLTRSPAPPVFEQTVPAARPTPALAFSPDASPADRPSPSPWTAGAHAPSTEPGPQPLAAVQPFGSTPDPRHSRGPSVVISQTRIGDGLLVAAAAATVAGVIWWAVVALTQRQIVYVAVILGVLVGQAALVGGRRGSLALGLVAGLVTLLSLTAAQYFISRSLYIAEIGGDVPLWEGSAAFLDVIRNTFEEDPVTGLFVLVAAGIAGFQAGVPGRRASGPLGEVRAPRAPDRVL